METERSDCPHCQVTQAGPLLQNRSTVRHDTCRKKNCIIFVELVLIWAQWLFEPRVYYIKQAHAMCSRSRWWVNWWSRNGKRPSHLQGGIDSSHQRWADTLSRKLHLFCIFPMIQQFSNSHTKWQIIVWFIVRDPALIPTSTCIYYVTVDSPACIQDLAFIWANRYSTTAINLLQCTEISMDRLYG
jgi:hypothetical protein